MSRKSVVVRISDRQWRLAEEHVCKFNTQLCAFCNVWGIPYRGTRKQKNSIRSRATLAFQKDGASSAVAVFKTAQQRAFASIYSLNVLITEFERNRLLLRNTMQSAYDEKDYSTVVRAVAADNNILITLGRLTGADVVDTAKTSSDSLDNLRSLIKRAAKSADETQRSNSVTKTNI